MTILLANTPNRPTTINAHGIRAMIMAIPKETLFPSIPLVAIMSAEMITTTQVTFASRPSSPFRRATDKLRIAMAIAIEKKYPEGISKPSDFPRVQSDAKATAINANAASIRRAQGLQAGSPGA